MQNGVVLTGKIAKEVVSRKLHANPKKTFSKLAELGEDILSLLPSHHRSNPYYGVYKTVTRIWRTFLKFAKICGKMADSRRQTRSTRRRGPQSDAQFWSNQLDPLMIERGQADAI